MSVSVCLSVSTLPGYEVMNKTCVSINTILPVYVCLHCTAALFSYCEAQGQCNSVQCNSVHRTLYSFKS